MIGFIIICATTTISVITTYIIGYKNGVNDTAEYEEIHRKEHFIRLLNAIGFEVSYDNEDEFFLNDLDNI